MGSALIVCRADKEASYVGEFQVIELVCSPRFMSGFDSTKVCSSCNAEEGEWR
jgi:hypothetical protein